MSTATKGFFEPPAEARSATFRRHFGGNMNFWPRSSILRTQDGTWILAYGRHGSGGHASLEVCCCQSACKRACDFKQFLLLRGGQRHRSLRGCAGSQGGRAAACMVQLECNFGVRRRCLQILCKLGFFPPAEHICCSLVSERVKPRPMTSRPPKAGRLR